MQTILHIGMPKAASTFLQTQIFPNLKDVCFLGKYHLKNHPGVAVSPIGNLTFLQELMNSISAIDNWHLADLPNFSKSAVEKIISEAEKNYSVLVISEELYATLPFVSNYLNKYKHYFPDLKVLIIVRNQKDIISSLYRYKGPHHLYSPKIYRSMPVSFTDWFSYLVQCRTAKTVFTGSGLEQSFLKMIDYSAYIDTIEEIVGRDNVLVYPFELLVKNEQGFLDYLSKNINIDLQSNSDDISNIPRNESSSVELIGLNILLGRIGLTGGSGLGLGRRFRKIIKLLNPTDLKNEINAIEPYLYDTYAEGNTRLAEKMKIDLSKLGYCVK